MYNLNISPSCCMNKVLCHYMKTFKRPTYDLCTESLAQLPLSCQLAVSEPVASCINYMSLIIYLVISHNKTNIVHLHNLHLHRLHNFYLPQVIKQGIFFIHLRVITQQIVLASLKKTLWFFPWFLTGILFILFL